MNFHPLRTLPAKAALPILRHQDPPEQPKPEDRRHWASPALAATLLLLLLSGCVEPTIAREATNSSATKLAAETEIPTTSLPEKVRNTWMAAVNSYPYEFGRRGQETRDKNLAAIEVLRRVPWPDLGKVSWVRLTMAARPDQPGITWLISQSKSELVLLMPDLSVRRVERKFVSKVESVDPATYFDRLLEFLKNRKSDDRRPWDYTFIQDFGAKGLPYYGGSYLLHQAYAAAWLDRESVSTALVHEAFQQHPLAFVNTLNEGAWQSFSKGIQMLEDGEPRAEVLAHWQQTLQLYPASRYKDQLADLVGQLRIQVREDAQLARSRIPDVSMLTQEQLIQYYVERLGDVHGYQVSQPGHCRTLGMGEGTTNSDALVKIGRPAIPALLGLLRDQRLTRSIGFWRNFSPDRVVLRYQDVAVQCIEAILDIRFYDPSSTSSYLSNEAADVQNKVIADIQAWWKEHGQESPLQGQLARLEAGSVYDRVRTLHKIESLDPKAIDPVNTK